MTPTELLTAINLIAGVIQTPAGEVRPNELRSLQDLGMTISRCYHPTATYSGVQIIERPWTRAKEWSADNSAVLKVQYLGKFTRQSYTMTIAVMARDKSLMTLPLQDTNVIPPAHDCQLRNWMTVNGN